MATRRNKGNLIPIGRKKDGLFGIGDPILYEDKYMMISVRLCAGAENLAGHIFVENKQDNSCVMVMRVDKDEKGLESYFIREPIEEHGEKPLPTRY